MRQLLDEIYDSKDFFIDLVSQGVGIIKKVRDSDDWNVQTKGMKNGYPDFVTRADKEVDELYNSLISSKFPHFKIISEEATERSAFESFSSSDIIVTLDPLDGTSLFAASMPGFSTMISLAIKQDDVFVPIFGIISIVDGPMIWGYHDDSRSLTNVEHPGDERLIADCVFSRNLVGERPLLDVILSALGTSVVHRRGVGPHTHGVACGETDLFAYEKTNIWDVFPAIPIIHACGGVTCDLNGNQVCYSGSLRVKEGFLALGVRLDHTPTISKITSAIKQKSS